jgi:hypothetical protein
VDGYFGTGLDAQPVSGGDGRRGELLEGVSADLVDGANDALEVLKRTLDSAGKIRDGAGEAATTLANRISDEAVDLPEIPDAPDVSPGARFDPGNFETGHTSRGTEKNVRDADVDIAPDGRVWSGAGHAGRLDG